MCDLPNCDGVCVWFIKVEQSIKESKEAQVSVTNVCGLRNKHMTCMSHASRDFRSSSA